MAALPVSGSGGSAQFELWCFNLRTEFKDKDDGPNGWTFRREAAAELIRSHKPAVVCVQEATPSMLDFLVSHIGDGSYSWVGTSRSLKTGDEMAGFLYNRRSADLVVHHTLWLAPDGTPRGSPGWDAMYPRTLETAVFRLSELGADGSRTQEVGLIRVLNTHFDHVGVQARKNSAELIAKTIAQGAVEWPQCVQIVTGDFNNIKANNEVYDILTRSETGLLDTARRVSLPKDIVPFTLHKFQGLEFDPVQGDGTVDLSAAGATEADARHIDWIMFRNGSDMQVEPTNYQVMLDRVPGGPYVSDHFPIRVTFGITRRTASVDAVLRHADGQDGPLAHQRSKL